jgi:hypothetical protein
MQAKPQIRDLSDVKPSPLSITAASRASSTASIAGEILELVDGFLNHPAVGQAVASMNTLATSRSSKTRIRSLTACYGAADQPGVLPLGSAVDGASKVSPGKLRFNLNDWI